MEPKSPVTGDSPEEPEPIIPTEADNLWQEDTVRSEVVQQKPGVPAQADPPESVELSAPPKSSTEPQLRSAYDYPFNISVISSDSIAIGKSMGYTLNASLTSQNTTWDVAEYHMV